MAIKRFTIDGYGQLELNNVAFRRDGRIEAQSKLDDTDFATVPAENGMLLAVDEINRVVKFDVDGSLPIALNYSSEHMYDERANGLKNFYLDRNTFLPRLGYLSIGDSFTTNCIAYDSSEFTDDAALVTALAKYKETPIYGGVCSNGAIKLTATKSNITYGPVFGCKPSTMPNGSYGVYFVTLGEVVKNSTI